MGLDDKIDNAAEKLGGKAKEGAGKARDDEGLEAKARPTRPKPTSSRLAKRSRTPSSTTDLDQFHVQQAAVADGGRHVRAHGLAPAVGG